MERSYISVGDLQVEVVRKNIKNLHLGVYPPEGRVRVATPLAVGDDAVRLAIIGRLGWIRRKRQDFEVQERQSERELVSGESHYYLGQRYRLQLVPFEAGEGVKRPQIVIRNNSILELHARTDSSQEQRDRVLQAWYRAQLRELVPPRLARWEAALCVEAAGWSIRRMKTRWGSCKAAQRHIYLNLELVKKPLPCLDYLIVHELTHLIEPSHNERFVAVMERHLPNWRSLRQLLNSAPLAHEDWTY